MNTIMPGDIVVTTPLSVNLLTSLVSKDINLLLEVNDFVKLICINKPVPEIRLSDLMPEPWQNLQGCHHNGGPSYQNCHILIHTFSDLDYANQVRENLFFNQSMWYASPLFLLGENHLNQPDNYRCYSGFHFWPKVDMIDSIEKGLFRHFPYGEAGCFSDDWTGKWEELQDV